MPGRPWKWPKEVVLAALRERKTHGLSISPGRLPHLLYEMCRDRFGSWETAVSEAGFDPSQERMVIKWSRQLIVAMIRELKKKGEAVYGSAVPESLYARARSHFGSWDKALLAVGLDPSQERRKQPRSRAWVIDQLQGLKAQKKPIHQGYLQRKHNRIALAIYKHFPGGWAETVALAGYDPEAETARWTPTRIIQKIWERKLAGKPVNYRGLPRRLSRVMVREFGSWRNAVEAAGLLPEQERKTKH